MAYDEELARRLRELLAVEEGVTEQRMFGGLGFMVHGHMAIAASGQGGALVRSDPDEADRHIASGEASPFLMRDRPVTGWVHVRPDHLGTDEELQRWIDVGVGHARTLPPKR